MSLIQEFQMNAVRLLTKPGTILGRQLHAAIGCATEAGELLDQMKKHWIYNKELDRENVLEECGDLLFYVASMLDSTGFTLEEAMLHNINKLNTRYPQGYTDAAAVARADKVKDPTQ